MGREEVEQKLKQIEQELQKLSFERKALLRMLSEPHDNLDPHEEFLGCC